MKNLWPLMKKLLKALELRHELYLVNRKMVYSFTIDKMCTAYELSRMTPAEEYYKAHPEKKKKDVDFVREEIFSSFKQSDVLLKLVSIYKGGDG